MRAKEIEREIRLKEIELQLKTQQLQHQRGMRTHAKESVQRDPGAKIEEEY